MWGREPRQSFRDLYLRAAVNELATTLSRVECPGFGRTWVDSPTQAGSKQRFSFLGACHNARSFLGFVNGS